MSKHNYSQYSNKNNKPKIKTEETVIPVVEETFAPEIEVTTTVAAPATPMEIKMESVPTTEPKKTTGVVANCTKLNVRAEPSANAEVVCVLSAMSEIEINVDKSTAEWLSICTITGIEGYCMRKFVDTRL